MQSIKLIPNITSNFLLGQPHTSLILSLESGQVLFPPSHHSYSKCFLFCLRPESLMILIITYMCQCVLSCLTKSYSLWPYELIPPGSSVQGILRARTLGWVAMTSSRGLPNPGIKPKNPLQLLNAGRFFTAEPPGKPNPTPSDHLVWRVSLGEALKSCT